MTTATPANPGHEPVLVDEVMAFLAPKPGGVYCDATVGLGGHAAAILHACAPDGRVVGLDRDSDALARAGERLGVFGGRVSLVHGRFGGVRQVLEAAGAFPVDGCVVDLGVSSMQLDLASRGFSFRQSGPLDMRMDPSEGESAADLLRRVGEGELEAILRDFGEERFARKIAAAIVATRERQDLSSTSALAELIGRVAPSRERKKDPATRTFQALRIAINDELGELERFLDAVPACLRPGARLVVISFHSLEDRIVKRRLRAMASSTEGEAPRFRLLTKHVVVAGDPERGRNPRARSAKLRAAERLPA